jgi:hypothetical protein
MAQQTVNKVPRATVGEGVLGGVLTVAALSNPTAAAVPAVLLIAQGLFWAVRRTPEFQAWAEEKLAVSEEYDETALRTFYEGVLKRAPLPPPGVRLALPAPRTVSEELASPQGTTKPSGGTGIGQTLLAAFGDDNPLDRASTKKDTRQAQATRQRSGETQPIKQKEGSVTRKLQPVEPSDDDEAWLTRHAGATPRKASSRVMPIRELCELLNNDDNVDEKPHVILFGDSGSGKTTLAQLLIGTRPGKVVILDPKRPRGWKGAKWGGLPYVVPDKTGSYEPLVRAMAAIVREMDARYEALETMSEPPEQLTVVLDEAPDCVAASPALAALYQKVVRKGREAFVRLILISTTDRVGPLGFEGQGDLMNSLADVRLGTFASDVREDIVDQGENKYEWAVYSQGGWKAFNNSRTLELAERLNLKPSKVWKGVQCNCQVPEGARAPVATAPRAGTPAPARPVVAAKVVADRPVMDAGWLAELMLLAPNTVKRNLAEGRLEGLSEGANGRSEGSLDGRSLPSASDATSGGLPLTPQGAVSAIKGASPDEMRKLGRSWKLFTATGKKADAILKGFELNGYGRGYARGKELFDAWQLLTEKGLVTR